MKYAFIFFLSLSLSACSGQKSSTSGNKSTPSPAMVTESPSKINSNIDVQQAQSMISNSKDIILLDVRTPEEIALGKIGNAIEMDFTSGDFKAQVAKLDKNKEYIVYCAAGGRSSKAVKIMNELGFSKAYNLTSGYTGWPQEK